MLGGDEAFDEEQEPLDSCYACNEQATVAQLPALYAGKMFHQHCWLGVRCFLRTIAGSSKAQAEHRHQMTHQPDTWRRKMMQYITSADRRGAIQNTRRELQETESTVRVKTKEAVDDDLLLSKSNSGTM